jgi:hypothetical protein
MDNQTAGVDLDSLTRSTYENGPGNVPRLPDRVVDTLIDSAGVSRCAPGRTGITVRDQTANVEQLVHDTCEELLARLPDLARRAEPSVAAVDEQTLFMQAYKAAYPSRSTIDAQIAFGCDAGKMWMARAALASPAVSQMDGAAKLDLTDYSRAVNYANGTSTTVIPPAATTVSTSEDPDAWGLLLPNGDILHGESGPRPKLSAESEARGVRQVALYRRAQAPSRATNSSSNSSSTSTAATTASASTLDQQINAVMSVPDAQLDEHLRSIGLDPDDCEAAGRKAVAGALNTIGAQAPSRDIDVLREVAQHWLDRALKAEEALAQQVASHAANAGEADEKLLADSLNMMMWLYRRLPVAYGKPTFVDAAIMKLGERLGLDDVPIAIRERAAIASSAAQEGK